MGDLRGEMTEWCRGKNGWVRLPVVLWFGYLFYRYLVDPVYQSFLWPLNLGFHEIGHIVFGFDGKFLGILGGTLLESLAPVFFIFYFLNKRDFFSMALSFGWFSTALFSIARYAADARSMTLPLVSLSWNPEITHDWNYLLSRMHLLACDAQVGFLFRLLADASMVLCLGMGSWLVWYMITKCD